MYMLLAVQLIDDTLIIISLDGIILRGPYVWIWQGRWGLA